MNKRIAFALALLLVVFAAGTSLAATLTWTGEFKADGKYTSGSVFPEHATFFGPYDMTKSLTLSFSIKEDKGLWDASFALNALDGGKLAKYTVKLNDDAWQATVWGNYADDEDIGHKGDPLAFIRISGANTSGDPAFRVTTDALGVDLTVQVPSSGKQVAFNAEGDAGDVKLGATLENNFETAPGADDAYVRLGGYAGVDLGLIDLDVVGALSTEESTDNSAFGVGASADLSEKLNVTGEFRAAGENFARATSGYDLGATYTDGLLRLKGDYGANTDADPNTAKTTLGGIYRGSADNVGFNDLFKAAEYPKNVAFAFGATYTLNDAPGEAASTLALNATGPIVSDRVLFNANVTLSANDDGFTDGDYNDVTRYTGLSLDGHVKLGDKLTLKPHVSSKQWVDAVETTEGHIYVGDAATFTVKVGAEYAFATDASLRGEIGQTSKGGTGDFDAARTERFNSFGLTVKF